MGEDSRARVRGQGALGDREAEPLRGAVEEPVSSGSSSTR